MYRLRLARMGRLFTLVMLMVMITRVSSRHTRDIWSGDYKRYRESAETVEVIRRTPVRTLHNGEVVNKVLKRRKKYRRLPTRRVDADKISDASADNGNNSDDKPQLRETDESFEKLKPLKTNYKTSDSIRMHLKTPNHKIKTSRASKSGQHENKRNSIKESTRTKQPLALSDNFEFKKNSKKQIKKASPRQYDEQIGAESREHKTYKRFYGSHEEVLLASGDHNSLSIQGPGLRTGSSLNPSPHLQVSVSRPAALHATPPGIDLALSITLAVDLSCDVQRGICSCLGPLTEVPGMEALKTLASAVAKNLPPTSA